MKLVVRAAVVAAARAARVASVAGSWPIASPEAPR